MTDDLHALKRHVGRSTTVHDVASASQAGRLAAALSIAHPAPETGDALPQGWYGIYFPPLTATDELRDDGQPGQGLVPPVPLPRRQLAGVRAAFHRPIRIGDALTKVSEVTEVTVEDFGAGPVVGVKIAERISAGDALSVVEERTFLFHGENGSGIAPDAVPPPAHARWTRTVEPSPMMLFRLSAVRFNTHRIHYDRDYATGVEGMPGLAVPITLVSSQMIEMLREEMPDAELAGFSYRAVRRMFDTGAYQIHVATDGDQIRLWATDQDGTVCVLAEAELA